MGSWSGNAPYLARQKIFGERSVSRFVELTNISQTSPLRASYRYIDGLVHEGRNYIANALELRFSCTNPSIWFIESNLESTTAIYKGLLTYSGVTWELRRL